MSPVSRTLGRPFTTLLLVFLVWKSFLLCAALLSPGPGYDTSTAILLRRNGELPETNVVQRLTSRLMRWDAIYYTEISHRGYLYEQEWAFSWGLTTVLRWFGRSTSVSNSPLTPYVLAGSIFSNACHLLSVLVLHQLTIVLYPGEAGRELAFKVSIFHILSQAGIFLSAPYGESAFSLLNFLGTLFYASVAPLGFETSARRHACILAAGLCFGTATLIRSNGVLSGAIFLFDFLASMPLLPRHMLDTRFLMKLLVTGLAGVMTATGLLIPQYIAFQQFCSEADNRRSWCEHHPPSIFSWVQEHYWNVGFLRYWTVSNIPLFLLAAPTTYLMARSLHAVMTGSWVGSSSRKAKDCIARFSIPQALLAVLALTSFHVQIINRISSGYPLLYIGLAQLSVERWIVYWVVIYATIQCGLYASFLPPA